MSQARSDHSNVVLWGVFGLSVVGTGGFFLVGLHRQAGYDALLALAALVGRAILFVAAGLSVEALLLRAGEGYFTLTKTRRSVLHAFWVTVMALCVALVIDAMVFAFAGYHLSTAGRILFSDGPTGVGQVVEATGLSLTSVLLALIALAAGVAVAIGLSKWTRRLSSRWGITIARRTALRSVFVSIGALALVDAWATRVRNPFLWERELARIPLAFSLVHPRAELASFRAKLRPMIASPAADPGSARERAAALPDIIIVLVESLRADVVTPAVMPRFAAYARTAMTFEHATTTGNVTHFAWYGLLCSRLPIHYAEAKAAERSEGSLALRRLVDAGYRIKVVATPDLQYQRLESIIFGSRDAAGKVPLLHSHIQPNDGGVAERDLAVVKRFRENLTLDPKGGHVYLVALDSPHFEYTWGAEFQPPFLPYAKTVPITHDYYHDRKARQLVVNRYRNAVAWTDRLLGEVIDAIASSGRTGEAVVVIAGDHGEAFWEHETGTHGSRLSREQMEIGFAMSLPGRAAMHSTGVFSMLDVMPTILAELNLDSTGLDGEPLGMRDASHAALTFQGWNEQAFHFTVTMPGRRLLFELDHVDPKQAGRLTLTDVTDLTDVYLAGANGGGSDRRLVKLPSDLPTVLGRLKFLEF